MEFGGCDGLSLSRDAIHAPSDSMLVPYPLYRHILLTAAQLSCSV
jgi:hypothetical protein